MKLKFVKRQEIDTEKWDSCIKNAKNSLLYAYSWYLDIVAENWNGIIYENYSCVMPIVWNKKLGLKYTYRAFLLQQLGIFHAGNITPNYNAFLKILFAKFRFIDYNFNSLNKISLNKITENTNLELPLNKKYEELRKNFTKKHRATILKAIKKNIIISKNLKIEEFIKLKKKFPVNNLTQKNFESLKKLCTQFPEKAKIYGASKNAELLSASVYFIQDNRIYFLASVSTQKGKKNNSAFLLKNEIIKDFSNKNYILDFEGSNIPGVKHFFKGWGAQEKNYYTLKTISLQIPRLKNQFNF